MQSMYMLYKQNPRPPLQRGKKKKIERKIKKKKNKGKPSVVAFLHPFDDTARFIENENDKEEKGK